MLDLVPRFHDLVELSLVERATPDDFETPSPNGRALGDDEFVAGIEQRLGRDLAQKRPRRKKMARTGPGN